MTTEDKFVTIENLLQIIDTPLVVFDIGCRWGFQEHWKRLESVVQLIGMDADEQEVQSLNAVNKKEEYFPKVLGAKNGYGNLYITQDPACSSLYPPNEKLIRIRPGLTVTNLVSTKTAEISTLDDWAQVKGFSNIDFIKLDVQGAELDILQGAQRILQTVRMLEVEVQFNPIYQGVPLFGDVDRFLRQQGFSLWRIKNLSHYGLPEISRQFETEEIAHYDEFSAQWSGRGGQLYWADAFYVRSEIVYLPPRPWKIALRDACIAKVLGFEDLTISSVNSALDTCPADIAQKIKHFNLHESRKVPAESDEVDSLLLSSHEKRRIQMTVSCSDCDLIPKVPEAGLVLDGPNGRYQVMHNGIKVIEHGYFGPWMAEIIKQLHGHHEPQEEKAFSEILRYLPAHATMIELGSFWSYYSLWFQKQIANARNYMIEPDPNNLEVGRQNFNLNGMSGHFFNAAIGKESRQTTLFPCESDGVERLIEVVSVDDFVEREAIKYVDVLLSDIQGFELEMLQGATMCIEAGKIRFLVISTHHLSISNDPFTHQKCLAFLKNHGAHILVEHDVDESFSGDGLIVASFKPEDRGLPSIKISRNSAENSLFGESETEPKQSLWNVQETECQQLEMALRAKESERQELEAVLKAKETERQSLETALNAKEAQRQGLEVALNAVYASNSWRITWPLRKVSETIMWLKGRLKRV